MSKLENIVKGVRNFVAGAVLLGASILPANAQKLQVYANNDKGQPLSSVQVIANTKQGTLKALTDVNGLAVFDNVSDTINVTVAKKNYVGAAHKIFLDVDKTLMTALIDTVQTRNGVNGTGTENVAINSVEMKKVFNVSSTYIHNPILFDVQSAWPNMNIPVDASAFSASDTVKIWNYLSWRNDFIGKTVYIHGKVQRDKDRGILLLPNATYGTVPEMVQGDYYFESVCKLKSDLLEYAVLHEISWHGTAKVSDTNVGYHPSNYSDYNVITQPKDAVYMDLGYGLQFLRQTGKSNLDMVDYSDLIHFVTNHAPSKPAGLTPIGPVDPSQDIALKCNKSTDPDVGDWVRYIVSVQGPGINISQLLNDTVYTIPANTLQENQAYIFTFTSTDNQFQTQSDPTILITSFPTSFDKIPVGSIYLKTFPNPCNDLLYFEDNLSENYQEIVCIYSINGELKIRLEQLSGQNTHRLDVSKLKTGLYLLEITHRDNYGKFQRAIQKIIKE